MGEYWQLDPASTLGVLSFEYSLCEQNGNIFYTDSFLYEAQVNANGVFEGTTNTGEPFTFTPVREGSPFETETNNCGWQPDGNGDNLIGVNDLLDLLGVYGDTDYDQDGIWDSADDCVGEYDECGVCNGSGPSIPIIESIEILYDSVYAEQIDEWWVFEVGVDTTYTLVCEVVEGCTESNAVNYLAEANVDDGSCWLGCGSPLPYWGQFYETVWVNGQCWFAKNLNTTKFNNGLPIPIADGNDDWSSATEAAYCRQSVQLGAIYNGYVILDTNKVCPTGWHVSTNADWHSVLTINGSYSSYPQGIYCDAFNGLASTNWATGTNSTGLSIIDAGKRSSNGQWIYNPSGNSFFKASGGEFAFSPAFYQYCGSTDPSQPDVPRNNFSQQQNGSLNSGGSIRCVQD